MDPRYESHQASWTHLAHSKSGEQLLHHLVQWLERLRSYTMDITFPPQGFHAGIPYLASHCPYASKISNVGFRGSLLF